MKKNFLARRNSLTVLLFKNQKKTPKLIRGMSNLCTAIAPVVSLVKSRFSRTSQDIEKKVLHGDQRSSKRVTKIKTLVPSFHRLSARFLKATTNHKCQLLFSIRLKNQSTMIVHLLTLSDHK
jgi:hypothetical protein